MMTEFCTTSTRSIGLQVNLCHCSWTRSSSNSSSSYKNSTNTSTLTGAGLRTYHDNNTNISSTFAVVLPLKKSNQEMDSSHVNEAEEEEEGEEGMENEHLLARDNNRSRREIDQKRDQDRCSSTEEIEPLIHSSSSSNNNRESEETRVASSNNTTATAENTSSSTSTVKSHFTSKQQTSISSGEGATPPPSTTTTTTTSTTVPKKEHSHHYQFKRKFNFRSDSVFSDVLPSSSSQEYQKPTDDPEKSESLNSLKPKESKWVTLKKKLGKMNSPSASSSTKEKDKKLVEQKPSSKSGAVGGIHEKRSLLQRAKTLSILPVNRGIKERDEHPHPKKPVRQQQQPPELFNVGGEMNMIPLEFLIDINDLNK